MQNETWRLMSTSMSSDPRGSIYVLSSGSELVAMTAGAQSWYLEYRESYFHLHPTHRLPGGPFLGGGEVFELEADHSPPSSADTKIAWSCTATTPKICLIIHRDSFVVITCLQPFRVAANVSCPCCM